LEIIYKKIYTGFDDMDNMDADIGTGQLACFWLRTL